MIASFHHHLAGAALCVALCVFAGSPSPVRARQDPGEAAGRALRECVTAAQAGKESEARAAADRAGMLFRDLATIPGREADGLTGQGSVLSQCRIPFAAFMRQGELVMESIELAQRALAVDSMHLDARFLLAMNFHGMPAFLGRAPDAERPARSAPRPPLSETLRLPDGGAESRRRPAHATSCSRSWWRRAACRWRIRAAQRA